MALDSGVVCTLPEIRLIERLYTMSFIFSRNTMNKRSLCLDKMTDSQVGVYIALWQLNLITSSIKYCTLVCSLSQMGERPSRWLLIDHEGCYQSSILLFFSQPSSDCSYTLPVKSFDAPTHSRYHLLYIFFYIVESQ